MSEAAKQEPVETLNDNEKQAVMNTLSEFSRFVARAQYEDGQPADDIVASTYRASMEHTDNPRVGLFLAAGAAGSTRAHARGMLTAVFLDRISQQQARPELRDRIDRMSRSASQARQYPDGAEAIAIQGSNVIRECLDEISNPNIPQNEKDVLFATIFYAAAEAGPGSPAEHTAQTQLPPLQ